MMMVMVFGFKGGKKRWKRAKSFPFVRNIGAPGRSPSVRRRQYAVAWATGSEEGVGRDRKGALTLQRKEWIAWVWTRGGRGCAPAQPLSMHAYVVRPQDGVGGYGHHSLECYV